VAARKTTDPASRELLVRLLDEGYSKTGWLDRSLAKALRGVDVREALFRPAPGRHSTWEQVVHLRYWKHVLLHRIIGDGPVPFGEEGRDWFPRTREDEGEWRRERRRLAEAHRRFRQFVLEKKSLTSADVDRIVGAALHDVYHAAQIELNRRLYRARGKRRAPAA